MKDGFGDKVAVSTIQSGKFRRYNHLTFWQHFTVPSVVFGNFIDFFKNFIGLFQSLIKLIIWRPDVIFCKGGFVCVPIGLAAWILRIPLVIHDSDAHPGLANRILAKFAKHIATGAPLKYYNYPKNISTYVGIPVADNFKVYSKADRDEFKQQLGYKTDKPLAVITGGGLGAVRLNNAAINQMNQLSKIAQTVLISGSHQYDELKAKVAKNTKPDFYLYGFISKDMWKLLSAADIVVARAGATSNLELAALGKPTILVPNARLTGGHQVKNAQVYEEANAVEILNDEQLETKPEGLTEKIADLLANKQRMLEMSKSFNSFSKPKAASDMAQIILKQVK